MASAGQAVVPTDSKISFRIRVALSAILVPFLLFALVEGGLRIANVGNPTSLTVPCTVNGQAAACYNLFFAAPYFPPGIIHLPHLFAIPTEKSSNTYRIFVLGESAAMGDPDAAYGFSRYLEVMLRERFPDRHFEIVNTGMVAMNSHVSLDIARELADQRPDLFIIYSGNNEVVGPYGPGTAFATSAMRRPFIRAAIAYHRTRVGQLLTRLSTPRQEWHGMEMFLDRQVPASSPLLPYAYANYEANLHDTIALARRAGARVIVSTVATNLADCAPFASMHRSGLTPQQLHDFETAVQQGDAAGQQGSYREALVSYRSAERIDDQYAELAFRIARSLEALNDPDALRYYERARDLDTLRFRADSRINALNRSVAQSSGAELIDTEQAFAAASRHGVTRSDLVYEHVHMTPEGNYLLARAMFLQVAGKLSPQSPEPLTAAECEELLALTPHDRSRLAQEMFNRLQRPPFTTQLNHADQVLRLSLLAQAPDENPQQTNADYTWAIQRSPSDPLLRYNYGNFLFRFNQAAGAEQLRLSRPWDGFPVFAPNGAAL